MSEPQYVLAIDQGTTSSRAIAFDRDGQIVAVGQKEHRQVFPRPGWVEHDAAEIWRNTREVIGRAVGSSDLDVRQIAAIGITNQRESVVVWDRHTGRPVHNAIVWQDTRTEAILSRLAGPDGDRDVFKERTGLPLASYFSGPKVAWILENVDGVAERARDGDLLLGTMDSWVLWNLSGGVSGGVHATDVTNASRTQLMNLDTLDWNEDICAELGIPTSMLPTIESSSQVYAKASSRTGLAGIPIAGMLGDQQAATFGQACFDPGQAKNTYGTGCFLLLNTGTERQISGNGLLTTACYKLGDAPAVYALEGAIAVAGSLVQWVRDNLGLIREAAEIEDLARSVDDNGGAYIVPAFSGLFAPHWRPDARGVIAGLTRYVTKAHLARAVLEAVAYQTREVVDAMNADAEVPLAELKVDGGMVANDILMQFQADQLGVPVIRPRIAETTALGAAYAAGIAVGFWRQEDVVANWAEDTRWEPKMPEQTREGLFRNWTKAVTRTLDWVDEDTP